MTTLNFTPTELHRALSRGCLTNKQREEIVEVLDKTKLSERLANSTSDLRRYKKSPFGSILLATLMMGFEAGIQLASKVNIVTPIKGAKK